ncbi:peptide/nickel transport system substrate-binding protein [Caldanaerobacter subterraneus subsp. tengcongensis MB4]|uniref:ABC-type dipeptide/oligopeptide/nickel transport systems, periplasmic components n=1 Tax=Caldanaerobacter subterraneus subsp. tengcongensis (strain DSM 15242 / JCM 11007 / NBRC 100824 / MB4) TaxID=273068 RepID=Q8RDH7_CALS4|nr:ABC transporter substrate-binding protein [Caldanaerobacter subterraneus]AAM23362.1 ABC-type dipeptide/oligopeptide/nickel transport systems, periplasmic components [Caldanaerobacter subterraneus subsp. tengcongensis MB4]MCS3917160.1 peptide/nickel transport system substrate-binding protein [Caldanaerobacter subterraneus subsp. tengcongensis MB4]
MNSVLKKFIAIFVIVFFTAGIFAGCGQQTKPSQEATQETKPQETVKTGEIRLATDWPFPFHGNPFGPGGVGGAWWFVYEPFAYYIPQTGEYIPRLAESWKVEGNKVTVNLRKDAKFSDGEPFTSKDVVNTVNFIQAMWQWPYDIESVEAPDDHTVVFNLSKTSSSSFVHTLLTDGAMASLAPVHVYKDFVDQAKEVADLGKKIFYLQTEGKPVPEDMKTEYEKKSDEFRKKVNDFAPFKTLGKLPVVGSFEPVKVTQSEMEMKANKYHWASSQMKINRVIFKKWSSNEFVWASLISNEIDAAHPSMPKDVVEQLSTLNPKLHVLTVSDLSDISLVFNFKKPLFKDLNLRKAIAHILDRNKIRDVSVWQANSYENYADGILKSMESKWITQDTLQKLTKYNTDTAAAEEILKNAGYKKVGDTWQQPNGQPVAFTLSVYGPHNDWVLAAREVVQELNSFGFKVEMKLIPEGMRDQVMRSGDYDAAIEFGSAWWGYPHPLTGYQRLYDGDVSAITSFPAKDKYNTPWGELSPYDLVLELQKNLQDENKAMEIIQQLAYITNEYLPVIPLYEKVLPIYYNDGYRVTGWPSKEDPIWSLAPGGIERVYDLLITTGKLVPVK